MRSSVSIEWPSRSATEAGLTPADKRTLYNSMRHTQAVIRRAEMMRLFVAYGGGRGTKARIARELGVHRSAITRDFKEAVWVHEQPCPTCGSVTVGGDRAAA